MHLDLYAIVLVFSPLIASLIVGMNTRRIGDKLAQIITCCGVFISAFCSYIIFDSVEYGGHIIHTKLFRWFESGSFVVDWAIRIDVLTSVMLVLVSTVSSAVHLYSVGYMQHDEHKPRFMAYISLFTFFMMTLVCSDNLVQLFFGWEGVGLCSYLLVGFWFKKDSANQAALKAFIMNRIGDVGLALGIFLTFMIFGSVEFALIFPQVPSFANQSIVFFGLEVNVITLICLFIFLGCMGKSAQLGLHPWLADAMEGPTPVSALIHAATMVTAGVFLVARFSPVFQYSETALHVVTVVGASTCLFAATIALVQTDIKKIIAYSTCSQLGYMFLAAGVSAYSASIFHLLTHGFFKALLFLSAGSVIHAMNGEQNIFKMGGLARLIPFTYAMMWIGALALGGIYPFAGFYSKDMILEAAYASGTSYGMFGYLLGTLAAMCTCFYSWRLLIIVFNGQSNASKQIMGHVHESPLVMTIPLFILSLGAIFGGYVGKYYLDMISSGGEFWHGSIICDHKILQNALHIPELMKFSPLILGVCGIFFAYLLYMMIPPIAHYLYKGLRLIHTFLLKKWYFDEIYSCVFVSNFKLLGLALWKCVDIHIIDNIPNGAAFIANKLAKSVSFIQTGYIYHYAFVMFLGLVMILTWSIIGI